MSEDIPWSMPGVGSEELAEVRASFESGWLTQGPKVAAFEKRMADRLDVPHAVAVANGSIAIDIGLKVCGIGEGDEVIVPAITYFATAAAVSRIGAIPVFVDVDPRTGNLDPSAIEAAVGPRSKAVLYIDFGGGPASVEELKEVCARRGLQLIQDAAQTLGATWHGRPMGADTELSTMSFHMAKVLTTVEGGMIFTHRAELAEEARSYRNQGESAKYLHAHLGYNARMTDLSAGIGLAQLGKLDGYLVDRARVAEAYHDRLAGVDRVATMPCAFEHATHANFLYSIRVENRDEVQAALARDGIDTRVCYPLPLQDQEIYASGRARSRALPCPGAREMARTILNPPLFPTMTEAMVERIVRIIVSTAT